MTKSLFGLVLRTGMRRMFRRFQLAGAGCVVLGLLKALTGFDSFSVFVIIAGVVSLLLPWCLVAWSYRRLARLPQVPWSYHITDKDITERTPMFTSSREWSAVRAVTEAREVWVLQTEPAGVIGLPKQVFTPEQRSELRAFLVGRGLIST